MNKQAFKSVEDSFIEISELMLSSYTNFGGKIHGGYILGLMDQIAFACASKHSGSYCVTASVDKVNFLNSIEVGELVTMKASVNYVGNSSMVVEIRVEAENIRTGQSKHCNSSYFTMVAIDDQGKTLKVPGLRIKTILQAKRFLRAVERKAMESRKKEALDDIYKDVNDYLPKLKKFRVSLEIKE